jgi:hypothetical protein
MASLPHRRLVLFLFLNLLDLVLTWQLIEQGRGQVYEGNPLASWLLTRWGWPGLTTFKLGAVLLVGSIALIIARNRPRTGGRVLSFGCSALFLVLLYSSSVAACIDNAPPGDDPEQQKKQWLDGERSRSDAYRSLRRQLADDLLAGRCTLSEATAQLAASERGRDPRWLETLHKLYPERPYEDCLAANLVAFIRWSENDRAGTDGDEWSSAELQTDYPLPTR